MCEKSEVITEFGILFYLFIIIFNYNISSPSFNTFHVLFNQDYPSTFHFLKEVVVLNVFVEKTSFIS